MGRGHEPRGRKGDRYLTLVRNLAIQGGIVVLRHDVVVVGTGRHVDGAAQGVERDIRAISVMILVPHSYDIDTCSVRKVREKKNERKDHNAK